VTSITPHLTLLTDIFRLEDVKGFGPQKFKRLSEDGFTASEIVQNPDCLSRLGKRGVQFSELLHSGGEEAYGRARIRAEKQLAIASEIGASIITYGDRDYPKHLYRSNLPLPALYVRGDLRALNPHKAVACVGSRKIRLPFTELHREFAETAATADFCIVSGFATGADIIGHIAAVGTGGTTVCVMPSGLDRPFPPENKSVWAEFLNTPGVVFVSEFGFGVGANSLNLRKRNKTIVAMADGVLVSQSSRSGGAMNAFRFAIEQKKPVATFMSDGGPETSGNELIAGSSEDVRATVLTGHSPSNWRAWLQTL
jgi:DNA protecting protein DprA